MPDLVQNKLLASLTQGPNQHNLDLVNKNFTQLFSRLNAQNYAISEPCTLFSTSVAYPNLVVPTNLQVSIKTSGKPVLVFLRQRSDAITTGGYTAGGILIGKNIPSIFYITRGDLPIYGTILGGSGAISTPVLASYFSPSSIMAFDEQPPIGVQTYFLKVGVYGVYGNFSIIRGEVDNAGNIVNGEGFSVVHAGTGTYDITYQAPFLTPATPVMSSDSGIGSSAEYDHTKNTVSGCRVITRGGLTSILTDTGFTFMAMGPAAIPLLTVSFNDVELVAQELL